MKLGSLGEDLLLDQIARDLPRADNRKIFAGVGDDCAIVQMADAQNLVVLKTDCVVEGVHFLRKAKALHVGWKAMMRDRKSTRLNSSHLVISYAVFCLK